MTITSLDAGLDLSELPQHLMLYDVSWRFYEAVLRELGNRNIRVTYDDGRMELMAPLPEHEQGKKLLGRFVETMTEELEIPMASGGSTTFKRKDLGKGLEPDECYWIQNEAKIRGKRRLDLKKDPPPDLVIEMDITSRSILGGPPQSPPDPDCSPTPAPR